MKRLIVTMLIVMALAVMALTSGCTTNTQYGDCIGVLDTPKPNLKYELSVWNVIVAITFGETIFIPLYTVAKDIQCPVSPN